ncbi:hypothetical protein [Streptomyces sp. NPDC005485]|uniref:hypothetical protein n=1 Tax=Streptomyces sp. NPDC005485 TaxID=3155591 RepID=UPI0033AE1F56
MRGRVAATVVLVGLTVAGCGDATREDLVVTGTPPPTPYAGPLNVPLKPAPEDGDEDEGTVRALRASSGAAGRALECDGDIYEGGGADRWSKGDGGSTPEGGLEAYFDIEQPELPESGYRVEREEGGRVLFSFDVGGRTKVAVVVAKDQPHRPGWGPETSASCDPAELPASFTDSKDYEIWTDRDGRRVATTKVSSAEGAEHCDWQSAHFLGLGHGKDAVLYARDPAKVLGTQLLTSAYDADVPMPADARDTGYRFHDWQLWVTPDKKKVYVRTPDGVEAWPRTKNGVGCA